MKYNLHARNGMNSSWYIFTFFGITSIIRITWVRHILRALSCHVTLWAKSSESYQQQLLSIGTCESWLGNVCWSTCHEKYCFFVGFAETPSCYLRSSGLSKYAGSGEREGGGTAHVQPVDSYAPLCVNSVTFLERQYITVSDFQIPLKLRISILDWVKETQRKGVGL